MRWKAFLAGVLAGAVTLGAGLALAFRTAEAEPRPAPAEPEFPGGKPIDAAQISTGTIAIERMPAAVTGALDLHSGEIAKTAEIVERTTAILETKQARIRGTCAPGSAIRVVQADGTVVCERIPRGVISVSALSGVARESTTRTSQGAIDGAVGRYQTQGEEDFLVVPVHLPDGAVVTSFSYRVFDNSPNVDGAAYLYRSDDVPLAIVQSEGANPSIRSLTTESVRNGRIDNADHAYFVYMRISAIASSDLMPIGAAIEYKLP